MSAGENRKLLEFAAVRERLFPMLLPPKRVEQMGEGQVVARQLAEGLAVVYVEDTGPNEIRYVTWGDLQSWDLSPTGVHQVALWNLEARSKALTPTVIDPPGRHDPMLVWNVQDGYDASRLLLHRWVAEAAEQVRGDLILAVPDRHWLVATGDTDPQKRAAIRRLTDQRYHSSVFPVSPLVYIWQGEQLEVYEGE